MALAGASCSPPTPGRSASSSRVHNWRLNLPGRHHGSEPGCNGLATQSDVSPSPVSWHVHHDLECIHTTVRASCGYRCSHACGVRQVATQIGGSRKVSPPLQQASERQTSREYCPLGSREQSARARSCVHKAPRPNICAFFMHAPHAPCAGCVAETDLGGNRCRAVSNDFYAFMRHILRLPRRWLVRCQVWRGSNQVDLQLARALC